MIYGKTKNGNSPFLVEDGYAYFSQREGTTDHSLIITTEEDYLLNDGENADMMIKMGYTIPHDKNGKVLRGSK